jgi:hypothetical protein
VYRDASNLIQLCDVTTLLTSSCIGIVSNSAVAAGQPVFVWTNGTVVTGFPTLVIPVAYYVGASGGLIPIADISSGNYCTRVGWSYSTTSFMIDINIHAKTKA